MNLIRIFIATISTTLIVSSLYAQESAIEVITRNAPPQTKQIYVSGKIIVSKAPNWLEELTKALHVEVKNVDSDQSQSPTSPSIRAIVTNPQLEGLFRSVANLKNTEVVVIPSLTLLSGDHLTLNHPGTDVEVASFCANIQEDGYTLDLSFFRREERIIGDPDQKLPLNTELRRLNCRATIGDGETVVISLPRGPQDTDQTETLLITCSLIAP